MFEVTLPLRNAAEYLSDPLSDSAAKALPLSVRVLLVEDNDVNRLVARKTLQYLGLEVIEAANGEEAIRQYQEHIVDWILMDWHMPVMDGLVATDRIRQLDKRGKTVPIIGLTANVLHEHQNLCLASGMNAVITKPLNRQSLIDNLYRLKRLPDAS